VFCPTPQLCSARYRRGAGKTPQELSPDVGKVQGSIKTRQRIAVAANYWALQVLAQLLWKDRPTPFNLRERACLRTGDTVRGEREHGTKRVLTHAVRLAPWKAIPMQTDQKPHLTLPQLQRSSTSRDPEDEALIRPARDPPGGLARRSSRMQRFTSPGHAQRFLSAYGPMAQHFRPRRHLLSASEYRQEMRNRFERWAEITGTKRAA
jgi:hypothetical protein